MNNQPTAKKKILDLFSGIGGFSLAAHWVGWDTAAFCEWDEWCQEHLKRRFPGIPVFENIDNITDEQIRSIQPVWCVTGGFPCQPFSGAGNRRGVDDPRYKWPATRSIHQRVKPPWVVYENVTGLKGMAIKRLFNGMVHRVRSIFAGDRHYTGTLRKEERLLLEQILKEIEEDGFSVQVFNIPASGIGAWHQRQRLWIVAHSQENDDRWHQREQEERQAQQSGNGTESGASRITTGPGLEKRVQGSGEDGQKEGFREAGEPIRSDISVGNSEGIKQRNDRLSEGGQQIEVGGPGGDRVSTYPNSEGLEIWEGKEPKGEGKDSGGIPSGEIGSTWQRSWIEAATALCGADDGLPAGLGKLKYKRTASLKGLGNSIVPQIAKEIFQAINDSETA